MQRCASIIYKHGVYELPHDLLNDLRLRILENQEILGKCLNPLNNGPVPISPAKIKMLLILAKKVPQNSNQTFPVVPCFT